MTDRSEWEGRVGRVWAEEWRRTDRSFSAVTDRLLASVRATGAHAVLDVGCGAGELSLAIARSHPDAQVIGVDISEQLLSAARARNTNLANVEFELADAAQWSRDTFSPDLIVSRHGVMFFADPVAAFAHLNAIARPDGRLLFSCFRSPRDNPWAHEIAALVPGDNGAPADPRAPGPFAFADPEYVTGILEQAGWSHVDPQPLDFAYVAGAGADAVEDAASYLQSIGPAARAAAALAPGERARFATRLRSYLAANERDGIVAMPAAAWIVEARAGG